MPILPVLSTILLLLGECGALWGERERVVSSVHRQHGSHVYIACLQCILHNAQKDINTNLCIDSLGRAPSPISVLLIFPGLLSCFGSTLGSLSRSFITRRMWRIVGRA